MQRSSTTMIIVLVCLSALVLGFAITSLFGSSGNVADPSRFITATGGAPGEVSVSPSTVPPTASTVEPVDTATPVALREPTASPLPTTINFATPTSAPLVTPLPTKTDQPIATPAPAMVNTPTSITTTPETATTPSTDREPFVEYVVQRGDTLSAIALLFNVTTDDILAYNTIPNPASLTIGQTLRIPTGDAPYVEYVVQRGDTLYAIARRFGVSVDNILAVNDIRNPASLPVGQTLRIPRRAP
ncbi:MAG: LysM peptidoglycan-binding domain-containing protein [Roseiflexus sp.]